MKHQFLFVTYARTPITIGIKAADAVEARAEFTRLHHAVLVEKGRNDIDELLMTDSRWFEDEEALDEALSEMSAHRIGAVVGFTYQNRWTLWQLPDDNIPGKRKQIERLKQDVMRGNPEGTCWARDASLKLRQFMKASGGQAFTPTSDGYEVFKQSGVHLHGQVVSLEDILGGLTLEAQPEWVEAFKSAFPEWAWIFVPAPVY